MKKQWSFALITTVVCSLGVIGVTHAWAQNGVISFWDACNGSLGRAYVMRGEAESASNPRILVPLAPQSIGSSLGRLPLDISTNGPVTVLLFGLFTAQVDDIGGNLVAGTPIPLTDDPNWPTNFKNTIFARFSPTGDRVVITARADTQDFQGSPILVIADILRDTNQNNKIIGLENPTVVADLFTIGSPSDSNIRGGYTWTGFPDFSPDGTQIVVTIFSDLWLLHLKSDGHNLDFAEPLTRTVHDTEWNAVFSPDGNRIAYVGGRNPPSGGVRVTNIFTLNLTTHEVTQVSPRKGLDLVNYPAWSPDGEILAFTAQGKGAPENTPCGGLDIFSIKADGTGTLSLLTTTVGTYELYNQWGW